MAIVFLEELNYLECDLLAGNVNVSSKALVKDKEPDPLLIMNYTYGL
jgi:hypothetical protein